MSWRSSSLTSSLCIDRIMTWFSLIWLMVLRKYVFNLLMVEKVRSLVALVAGSGCVLRIALVLLNCNSCLHNVIVVGVYCVLRKNYYITIMNNFNERKRWCLEDHPLVARIGSF